MEPIVMTIDYLKSPIGQIEIRTSSHYVTNVDFTDSKTIKSSPNNITQICKQQLQEYFDGKRRIFDLPLAPQGTEFQKSVWLALTKIAFGETASYAMIANMINNPKAVRAVGAANGKNPIAIIIPCHRIIGSDGSLTGYAGGLERKAWLLEHEAVHQ